MTNKTLDYLGEMLMKKVRDKVIDNWDMILNGEGTTATPKKVHQELSGFSNEQIEIIKWLVPKIVDTTMHFFLSTIEQEKEVALMVKTDDGKVINIAEISDGLAGELYTEEGWIMRFSEQRYEEL